MDKFIKLIKNLQPNKIFMIIGFITMAYGGLGEIAGYSVVSGEERLVFITGVFLFVFGGLMAMLKAYMEGKSK